MNDITFIIHLRKDTEERAKNVNIVVEDDKIQNFDKSDGICHITDNKHIHDKIISHI